MIEQYFIYIINWHEKVQGMRLVLRIRYIEKRSEKREETKVKRRSKNANQTEKTT